jgi:thioredoxin-like negative regulator of GroEL
VARGAGEVHDVNLHHVPTVTDDMLRKSIDAAASPVAVLFFAGEPDRIRWVKDRFDAAAEELDDRVIFLRIDAEENPTIAACWTHRLPEIVVFRKTWPKARLNGEFTAEAIGKLVEAVLEEHYR